VRGEIVHYRKVLVPTDFSESARKIVESIHEVPGVEEVILAHILAATPYASRSWTEGGGSPLETVYAELRPLEQHLEGQGIRVTTIVETIGDADVQGAIVSLAEREHVDLIVMAPRGQEYSGGFLMGSVSGNVFRNARKDILIVPPASLLGDGRRALLSTVLVPTDFSEPSLAVLRRLEKEQGIGSVVLLHVVSDEERTDLQKLRAQGAEKRLGLLVADLEKAGIRAASVVRSGKAAPVILGVAAEEDVTLILMSRVGRMDSIRNLPLGSVTADVARDARRPMLVPFVAVEVKVATRELRREEFPLAEEIWLDYHQTKADPENDRIFGVFVDTTLISVARCKRHPDGYEVDAIFTPPQYRGHGYANRAVGALVEACHHDTLYMHSVLNLVDFYRKFGFEPIDENELPPTIKARFGFAMGALEGSNVRPMRRLPRHPYC